MEGLTSGHHYFTASGELTDAEVEMLYGTAMDEVIQHFRADPSYLVDIAASGSKAASRAQSRT